MSYVVAYFINQYPKVSHTFIRREIAALERQGVRVVRFALRGWDAEVTDAEDAQERGRTGYVLKGSLAALSIEALRFLAGHPGAAWAGFRAAWAVSRSSGQGLLRHLVSLAEACRLVIWMRRADVAHLHAHFGTNSAEVAMLARALGGPTFSFTAHGPEEFDKPEALALARKVDAASFVVAISSYGRSQLCRWVPSRQWPKVEVVHCGIEPGFFAAEQDLAANANDTLVCVGRLCEQKGQLLLVQAAAQLIRRGIALKLVLAGDGELRGEIEAAVRDLDIGAHVRITGWISSARVREELLGARALVLPSFAEGLPVVVMESMALGRPVISTFIAGIPELVQDGAQGWLIPAGDVDALAGAMQECLQAEPQRLLAMGRSARKRVFERHLVDAEAARLRLLFSDTIEGSRP